jgi:DNA-binding transcriptional ArsR family regulator
MSLQEFKEELQERIIQLLWRQWCALGVQGFSPGAGHNVIDVEALIIITCSIGRRESRLFDAMLDWLASAQGLISTQRLSTMMRTNAFIGSPVVTALAGYLVKSKHAARWKTLSTRSGKPPLREPLFQFKDGRGMQDFGTTDMLFELYGFIRGPVELRGLIKTFDPQSAACLQMRLRALFGVSSRSDILVYLITHPSGTGESPSHMSRELGYAQKAVQDALVAMMGSGLITRREDGRRILYRISAELRNSLTHGFTAPPQWIHWASIFSFLEQVWLLVENNDFHTLVPELQSIELRKLFSRTAAQFRSGSIGLEFSQLPMLQGNEFVHWGMETMREILSGIENEGA